MFYPYEYISDFEKFKEELPLVVRYKGYEQFVIA